MSTTNDNIPSVVQVFIGATDPSTGVVLGNSHGTDLVGQAVAAYERGKANVGVPSATQQSNVPG